MANRQSRRSVSLNRQLHQQLAERAQGCGVPLSWLVNTALRDAISRGFTPPPKTRAVRIIEGIAEGLARLPRSRCAHCNRRIRNPGNVVTLADGTTLHVGCEPRYLGSRWCWFCGESSRVLEEHDGHDYHPKCWVVAQRVGVRP